MEEKYPIKFSLGQFILLLGVNMVVLALVFLLGARFGGEIFPSFYAKRGAAAKKFQGLAPEGAPAQAVGTQTGSKLMDSSPEEETKSGTEGDPAKGAPHFQVDEDGTAQLKEEDPFAEEEGEEAAEEEPAAQPLAENKHLLLNPADKHTMVRFKSSDNSKFAVQVGEYFDELLASRKIGALKQKGIEAYLVIKNAGKSSQIYLVQVGSFSDRRLAEQFATQMSNSQGIELRVVQTDQP